MRERLGEIGEYAGGVVERGRRRSSCSAWAARRSRRRSCGARSEPSSSTCSTRRTRRRSAGLPTRSISSGRCSSSRPSRARRSRRARTTTSSGSAASAATDSSRSPTPALRSRSWRRERGSRVFSGEPTIGGRYSALSMFGLLPAALMSVDLDRLLARGRLGAERVPRRGRQPWPRARARARPRVGERPRQGRLPRRERLRPLARAAARRVHRQRGQGPRPRAGRATGRPGPPAARRRDRRSVRPRQRVLPLGVRDGGRGRDSRDQPVQPAERAGGQGPNGHDSRRRREPRGRARGRSTSSLAQAQPGDYVAVQAFVDPAEEERLRAVSSTAARRRPAASSRSGSARGTSTRPASCTRAARRSAASCRSSTTRARSWRSRASRSALAASSTRRLRETMQR